MGTLILNILVYHYKNSRGKHNFPTTFFFSAVTNRSFNGVIYKHAISFSLSTILFNFSRLKIYRIREKERKKFQQTAGS